MFARVVCFCKIVVITFIIWCSWHSSFCCFPVCSTNNSTMSFLFGRNFHILVCPLWRVWWSCAKILLLQSSRKRSSSVSSIISSTILMFTHLFRSSLIRFWHTDSLTWLCEDSSAKEEHYLVTYTLHSWYKLLVFFFIIFDLKVLLCMYWRGDLDYPCLAQKSRCGLQLDYLVFCLGPFECSLNLNHRL